MEDARNGAECPAERLLSEGNLTGCIGECRRILAQEPGRHETLHLLGAALAKAGDSEAGLTLLAQCLARAEGDLRLRLDYGLALAAAGRLDWAIETLTAGARHHPGNPDLALRLGGLLSGHGRHRDAITIFRAGLRARPYHLELRGALIAELAGELQLAEALTHLRLMRLWLPDQSMLYVNEALMRQSAGKLDEAITLYRRALLLAPDNHIAHVNLATALLSQGRFSEGFSHYEYRLALPDLRQKPAGIRVWQGETLAGRKLLLTSEQGYGDLIQFIRFLALLENSGGEIWLECPAELARLFADLPGLAGLLRPGDQIPRFDYALPLLSLPQRLDSAANLLVERIPYLRPPPDGPVPPADPRRKIGLVWQGREAQGDLFTRRMLGRRAAPLEALAPLWQSPDYGWYSLQLGPERAALAGKPIVDLAPLIKDFADSASLLSHLDLLITIDSAAAHLAGALGLPVWLMLGPGQCDYRWTGPQGGSPWYPEIRLCRVEAAGWDGLARQIANDLALWRRLI